MRESCAETLKELTAIDAARTRNRDEDKTSLPNNSDGLPEDDVDDPSFSWRDPTHRPQRVSSGSGGAGVADSGNSRPARFSDIIVETDGPVRSSSSAPRYMSLSRLEIESNPRKQGSSIARGYNMDCLTGAGVQCASDRLRVNPSCDKASLYYNTRQNGQYLLDTWREKFRDY